jgi:site-specific recombinase XerD
LKKNTQNKYLIALRSFLKYLERQDVQTLAAAKIELAKAPMREIDIMTDAEFEKLMNAPSKQNFEDTRDKAILEMLFSTGLRVSELCSLNSDLDISAEEFTIRGKGEKLRIVFISDAARVAIKTYLDRREKTKFPRLSDALFVMSTGKRIYPRAVQRIIDKRRKQAGIMRDISPHGMRHYFATNLLKNGADIRSVQIMLGHASINTTQVYTNISDTYLKEIHKKFHKKKG